MTLRTDTLFPIAVLALLAALTVLLTAIVFLTRKDFSFLRTVLWFAGFAALGLIVVSILFNFALGPVFTYAKVKDLRAIWD